jgi:hypothetical protein
MLRDTLYLLSRYYTLPRINISLLRDISTSSVQAHRPDTTLRAALELIYIDNQEFKCVIY